MREIVGISVRAAGIFGVGPACALSLGLLIPAALAAAVEGPLVVTATAYNSVPGQTRGDPSVAAWGDVLEPGTKAIAVSRDLIRLGLTRGARVRIEGLPGEYLVLDKMARHWRRRIDIYMGDDVEAARAWGVRKLHIHWRRPRRD
ncbi:MAG: 3D domain-containing protein [Myxococcales bacterium]|nr:3D domain-containing protein [Myxococcales bacterium]MDH5306586.1 3D domain-containing protein [Myxococcales bacterium]